MFRLELGGGGEGVGGRGWGGGGGGSGGGGGVRWNVQGAAGPLPMQLPILW